MEGRDYETAEVLIERIKEERGRVEERIILLLLFEFNLFLFCFLCSLIGIHCYGLSEMQDSSCFEYVFHVHVHYLSPNSSALRI